jgi:CLIP-associating protein 1/2
LTLVRIRRAHHLFPIRPYLPQLVAALEDGDAHVRECARPSVIELFTGPGVTDAARADLKKEMTKKGVRKTIVDGVLSKLVLSNEISDGDSASGPGTKSTPYIPPSLALQGSSGTSTTRTTNTASVKDNPRPASRAAMTEPPTPSGDNTDIKPVYVSCLYIRG